jgi:hypothetical protein
LGLGTAIAGIASIVLAVFSARLFWSLLDPPPEIQWHLLDPNDPSAIKDAYSNLHVIASLARILNENDAQTHGEFVDQIRRLDHFGKPTIWHRVSIDDHGTLVRLFQSPEVVDGTARRLRTTRATSVEELRE